MTVAIRSDISGTLPWRDRIISQDGLEKLKRREGLRLKAYEDIGGTRTIGYGHAHGVMRGEEITQLEAEKLLLDDVSTIARAVADAVKQPVTQDEYDALISFAYNVGPTRFKRSDVLKHLNAGDIQRTADALLGWCHVAHKFSRGLFNRRQAEAKQFLGR